jgi:ribonuclease HI
MKIYTDGSVTGKKGGAAAVSNEGHMWGRFIETNDAYFAELDAVLLACEKAEAPFCLVSDHMDIVNKIRAMIDFDDWTPPNKGKELWIQIRQYCDKIEGVEWMKRRSNQHMINVDDIARMASHGKR